MPFMCLIFRKKISCCSHVNLPKINSGSFAINCYYFFFNFDVCAVTNAIRTAVTTRWCPQKQQLKLDNWQQLRGILRVSLISELFIGNVQCYITKLSFVTSWKNISLMNYTEHRTWGNKKKKLWSFLRFDGRTSEWCRICRYCFGIIWSPCSCLPH